MEKVKQRIIGIDFIKAVAIFSVISEHFFLNTRYYVASISNNNMYFETLIRWMVIPAVPLFMISTGFLQNKAEISKSYFIKIIRVLIIYILISILCILYKHFYLHVNLAWQKCVSSIFDFTANNYSWYVNMYIGLFFITPFLNLMLPILNQNKKKFQLLLLILFLLVSLPSTLYQVMMKYPNYFIVQVPNFWQGAGYPVLYYLIGAYIKEFKPKINVCIAIPAVLIIIIVECYFYVWARQYPNNQWYLSNYDSSFLLIESVIIFMLFYNVNFNNKTLRNIFAKISSVTLEMYLFSNLVDSFVYTHINLSLTQEVIFKKYILLIIPLNITVSLLISLLFKFTYNRISHFMKENIVELKKMKA